MFLTPLSAGLLGTNKIGLSSTLLCFSRGRKFTRNRTNLRDEDMY